MVGCGSSGIASSRIRTAGPARRAIGRRHEYDALVAERARGTSLRRTTAKQRARANRKAIGLRPDEPAAYFNLGNALNA
jgi:hypothetical protein